MGSVGRTNHRDPRGQSHRTRVPRHVHRDPTRLHPQHAFIGEKVAIDVPQIWFGIIEDQFGR
jgi:hypothetical protein